MTEYNHLKIEQKWQKEWEKNKIYHAKDNSKKPKYYSLIEFPYPSGSGLHVGHIRSDTAMDIISRKRRMEGYNVLYPIGWDAFGLPTENYAIKTGIHPIKVTKQNTDIFRRQLKALGFSFDWSREINTTDPKYYKWTQWIFLQFLKKGLAYKDKSVINWCPKDKIGLANEEVIGGACERCGTPVEKREKEQWMLGITKYAERLDKDLDTVDYLPQIKLAQRNWIGRSEGAEIEFKIKNTNPSLTLPEGEGEIPRFFTTNPELWRALQNKALEMRKNPTNGEKIIWEILRRNNPSLTLPEGEGRNSNGCHFRRQHIVDRFIVDFVCIEKKLVIEIDGDIHDYTKTEDFERTKILNQLGFEVMRFTNDEVIKKLENVKQKIISKLNSVSGRTLSFGEGQGGVFGEDLGGVESTIKVFTTRPDTIFGATFLAIAPELAKKLTGKDFGIKADPDRENKEKIGVDTELKAKNPATGKEIPVWVVNYVSYDYGTGAIMAVPAHDERDFEFAKKYELPIKNVIEPLFTKDNGEDALKSNLPLIKREAVVCVVKHWKEEKYLCLKWKKVSWSGFVTGGIDGEDPVLAGKREILEETGYKNAKFIKELGQKLNVQFYHVLKKENRWAHFHGLYFELENGEQEEISEEEKDIHDILWLTADQVEQALNVPDMKLIWRRVHEKDEAFTGKGIMINSGKFSGMDSEKAKKEIIKFVGGKEKTTFKLRDWVFSRQRYWGEPIPLINCGKCGFVPVPEKDLPVVLPKVVKYKPTDNGESPLAEMKSWVNVKCPKCKGKAKRETDTMPNWAGSSWYFLRYTDPKNNKEFASKKHLKYWLGQDKLGSLAPKKELSSQVGGVDWYNGGMEHTTLHLLYSRFWHKFLYDLKLVPTSEPYMKRTSHGMILAEQGEKMSKSKGNTVNPDDLIKIFGADTLRMYEMFMGSFDQSVSWNTDSMVGPRRFLERVWKIGSKFLEKKNFSGLLHPSDGTFPVQNSSFPKILNKTIKKVSEDIEDMRFNTAISSMMMLVNEMEKSEISSEDFKKFLQILAPFAPHITEELWQRTVLKRVSPRTVLKKNSIHLSVWPKWDENLIQDEEIKIVVQINGKLRAEIMIKADEKEEEIKKEALQNSTVLKHIAGKELKKVIYVKNRLINIVI